MQNRMQNDDNPHEAQTTSVCSERNKGNLGEGFVSNKCFGNTGRHWSLFVCVLTES